MKTLLIVAVAVGVVCLLLRVLATRSRKTNSVSADQPWRNPRARRKSQSSSGAGGTLIVVPNHPAHDESPLVEAKRAKVSTDTEVPAERNDGSEPSLADTIVMEPVSREPAIEAPSSQTAVVNAADGLVLHCAAQTHIGGRENNEDLFLLGDGLFIVADGMGGQSSGEVASRILIETFKHEDIGKPGADWFTTPLYAAHDALCDAERGNSMLHGLGTTVTAARSAGGKMAVRWSGDTDFFRLRAGKLEKLTTEHSLAAELFRQGRIKAEEVKGHRFSNVLYNYVGATEHRPRFDEAEFDIEAGDIYLISSDGLSDYCDLVAVTAVLSGAGTAEEKAQALVKLALDSATKDNVTVIVIEAKAAS